MGLAAPKRRSKLSGDPNNNNWSRSTNRFGHKILTAQGWKAGDYLGPQNAPHSKFHTAANVSHIRVALKDDNLGLGAKTGRDVDTFGLDLFQGVLGRLNGKSDAEIQKQEKARKDVKARLYQDQRWGTMQFVSGGFLVDGERIQETSGEGANEKVSREASEPARTSASKKRRRDLSGDNTAESTADERRRSKKSKKEKKRNSDVESGERLEKTKTKGGKSKRKAKEQRDESADAVNADSLREHPLSSASADIEQATADSMKHSSADGTAEKQKRKREKQARREAKCKAKEEKKRRKDKKRKRKEEATSDDEASAVADTTTEDQYLSQSEEEQKPHAATVTPAGMSFSGGRHAVRQRYIQQKKMASLNAQALNEIFMIKAPA